MHSVLTFSFCNIWAVGTVRLQMHHTPSYPLRSAPQRFTLAHRAPGESLLLAGGWVGGQPGMGETGRWFSGMFNGWMDSPNSIAFLLFVLTTLFIWPAVSFDEHLCLVSQHVTTRPKTFWYSNYKYIIKKTKKVWNISSIHIHPFICTYYFFSLIL